MNLLEDLIESHRTGPINLYYLQNEVDGNTFSHFCYCGPNLSASKTKPNEIAIFTFEFYGPKILEQIRACAMNCQAEGYEAKFYTDLPRHSLLTEKPKTALGVWATLVNEYKYNAWDAMVIMLYNMSAFMPPMF